jgi:hypothetical protein
MKNTKQQQPVQGLPVFNPYTEITEQAQQEMQQQLHQYEQSNLCATLSDYYRFKPHYQEKKTPYIIARLLALLGHFFSICIGMYLAFKIGNFLFSWFSSPLNIAGQSVTVGAILGAAIGATGLILWEVLKNYKFRQHFKNSLHTPAQYKKGKKRKRNLTILSSLLLISMLFNGIGGFEAVNIAFGDAPEATHNAVNVEEKVAHLVAGIARKDSTLSSWEKAQKERTENGQERMYKLDKAIIATTSARDSQEIVLAAKIDFWEEENKKAGGKTKKDNTAISAAHNADKYYYAILCAIVALIFDLLVISCLFYVEDYRFKSHQQLMKIKQQQQPIVNSKQQEDNNSLPIDNKPTQEEVKPEEDNKQPPVNNVNNAVNSPLTEDFVKYEVITGKGTVPFVIYNKKELTLRQAKQRLAVARGRVAAGKDTKGTNKKHIKTFTDIIKSFTDNN